MLILRPRGTSNLPAVVLVASVLLVAAGVAGLIRLNAGRSQQAREDQHWRENHDRLLALKSEAEALAIEGNLVEAHAKYRQIEQLVGGRHPKDPALWDLAERAKQDQDRIYLMLLNSMQPAVATAPAEAVARPSAGEQLNPAPTGSYGVSFEPTPGETTPGTMASTEIAQPASPAPGSDIPQPVPATRPSQLIPRTGALTPNPRVIPAALGGNELDAAIGRAIERGVNFLTANLRADQVNLPGRGQDTFVEGANALVVYALLQSGRAIADDRLRPQHPFMKGLLARLKEHPILPETRDNAPVTYARALRACALAVYARPEDRETLLKDVQWLVDAHTDGAYTYRDPLRRSGTGSLGRHPLDRTRLADLPQQRSAFHIDPENSPTYFHNGEPRVPVRPPPGTMLRPSYFGPMIPGLRIAREKYEPPELVWDNSNSQYGLMGVWAGAEAGVEVSPEYFATVEQHWMRWQLQNGEWEYNGREQRGYFAMTVAGIASLLITHDYLDAPALGAATGRQPYNRSLAMGLTWLEKDDNPVRVTHGKEPHYLGYNLFGLARVGLASGFKYFGTHDWYRELAAKVLELQHDNGAWGRDREGDHAIIDTAYMLLFLSRGRAPVMMNKLRFDGSWNNRARDLANLSLFATRELERQLNWQVVNLQKDWHDWLDAPILYIASHAAPKLNDQDLAKLRQFAEAGGLIFTHADASSNAFNTFAQNLAKQLFPSYELANLPESHELYSLQYKITSRPPLRGVSNGSRLLMVHAASDLSTPWQVRNGLRREAFELGVNLFVYAAGKSDLRNRLNSPYVGDTLSPPARTIRVARLRHSSNWDPEPYAWVRLDRLTKRSADLRVQSVAVDVKDLRHDLAPVAHLTGTHAWQPTDSEIDAVRHYVEDGGVLLIDSCGGSEEFARSAAGMIARAFPGKALGSIPANHRLLAGNDGGARDPVRLAIRPYAQTRLGTAEQAPSMLLAGKGAVIFTPLDLTTGLLGSNTWMILGYNPASAERIVANVLLWTAAGKPQ